MGCDWPIGIFDSGIGGLTVARAVVDLLPNESIIYVGDTAHLPYGDKSAEAVQHYALRIADFLVEQRCKLLLIACHTASAVAYDAVREHVRGRMPVVNVIDPVVQQVAAQQQLRKVGIIGTRATIRSQVYERRLRSLRPDIETVSLATALLAGMIEEGFYNNSVSQTVIKSYLQYPDFNDIDAMILGCTHYPLIRGDIEAFFHRRIAIFDSTVSVAVEVKNILWQYELVALQAMPFHRFYVTDYTDSFEQTTRLFFNHALHLERLPLWGEVRSV